MTVYYDAFTGKPVDRLSDLLSTPAGYKCDECQAEVMNRCYQCGAPQCCPRCCFEATEEMAIHRLKTLAGKI